MACSIQHCGNLFDRSPLVRRQAASDLPSARTIISAAPVSRHHPIGGSEDTHMWERLAERLDGTIVVLEPIELRHADGLRAAAADERAWRYMVTTDVEAWLAAAYAEQETGARVQFATLRAGTIVGSTSYMSLTPEHLRLEIGNTWLHPSAWGTGANTEAKYLQLRHAFEVLGCWRVEFKTDAQNERARAALAALPAEFEGVHRKHMLVRGGDRRDSAWYAVIDDDWPRVKDALERRLQGTS
jgi:RimJ/RimL family protein N-acetyltransferase